MQVGKRIKNLRGKKGLSQNKLAKITKVFNQSQICKIENGDRDLKVEEIMVIAQALDVSISDILGNN